VNKTQGTHFYYLAMC